MNASVHRMEVMENWLREQCWQEGNLLSRKLISFSEEEVKKLSIFSVDTHFQITLDAFIQGLAATIDVLAESEKDRTAFIEKQINLLVSTIGSFQKRKGQNK